MMSKMDFSRFLVDNPSPFSCTTPIPNTVLPSWQLLSSSQVPECNYNILFNWITGIPDPDQHLSLHKHPYNEVMVFLGGDCSDPENLFAEIEFNLGGQKLSIDSSGAVFIPAGVPHGQSIWHKLTKPHVCIILGLGSGIYHADHSQIHPDPDVDFRRCLVNKPAYEVLAGTPVKGRQGPSSMTFMNNNLVHGSNIYVEGGWVWDIPDPNPHIFEHAHNYEEIVVHFGADYHHPLDLGAEIEFGVGGQPLILYKTSAVFVPSGIKHGPLTWNKYQHPHFEMAIMPGAGTLDEADPGGHREKARRKAANGKS
jgi:hypothetical protein